MPHCWKSYATAQKVVSHLTVQKLRIPLFRFQHFLQKLCLKYLFYQDILIRMSMVTFLPKRCGIFQGLWSVSLENHWSVYLINPIFYQICLNHFRCINEQLRGQRDFLALYTDAVKAEINRLILSRSGVSTDTAKLFFLFFLYILFSGL